jgi:hypothetical protein
VRVVAQLEVEWNSDLDVYSRKVRCQWSLGSIEAQHVSRILLSMMTVFYSQTSLLMFPVLFGLLNLRILTFRNTNVFA